MSELSKRVWVSVIAAPLALAIVFAGGAALAGLLAVASAVAAWEYYRIARSAGHEPLSDLGCALAGLIPLAVHARYLNLYQPGLGVMSMVVLVTMGVALWARGSSGKPIAAVATTLFGAIYTGGMLSFAYALRNHDYAVGTVRVGPVSLAAGGVLLGLPVLLTWATDIGAFQVGRAVGGRKLMPSVSPGKTVSGAVGGLAFAVLIAWLYAQYALRPAAQLAFSPLGLVAFAVIVSVSGQVGDRFESMLKREAGVKDSSRLIPGHGGVLDRLDSLFFVLPVAYALMGWLLIPAPR
ncbi:MAG TPA: phosphatidate cytidylyltransferase [Gemmatimonadaceae bacterium]